MRKNKTQQQILRLCEQCRTIEGVVWMSVEVGTWWLLEGLAAATKGRSQVARTRQVVLR